MHTTLDDPAAAPAPAGPYSHVARIDTGDGALLFVSGQVAVDDAGDVVGKGDIEAQSRRIFEIFDALLRAHGATFDDVVNIRTYLVDMDQRAGYAKVRREFLTGTPPTSTTVEVSRLFLDDALLEVELVATVTP